MVKNKRVLQKLARATSNRRLSRRFAEEISPDFVAGIRDHEAADHSTHAMADENDRLSIRKFSRNTVQLMAKQGRRIRIWISALITDNPKLITAFEFRLG